MFEAGELPPFHSQEDIPDQLRREAPEELRTTREQFISPREASDIRIRQQITWAVIAYYGLLLVSTIPLFYLQGFGAIALSDVTMASLSGVLVGNTTAGVFFLQVVKSIFPTGTGV